MTKNDYDLMKKQEYLSNLGIEYIDDSTSDDIKQEWLKRLNQIKSGHLLGLTYEQIDVYCALDGYEKREFVKSCVHEGIHREIIDKIILCDDLESMIKLKSEHYKSDYIMNGINNKVNSLYGALDDCEQKFSVFEKYLEQFSEQLNKKEQEISSLRTEISEYRSKVDMLQEENKELRFLNLETKAQYEQISNATKSKEIVVTRVIKQEIEKPVVNENKVDKDEIKSRDKKTLISGVKQLFNKNTKVVNRMESNFSTEGTNTNSIGSEPKEITPSISKYTKEKDVVSVNDIESYILSSNLTSEQLLEISKCFTMDIADEQIIAMIENNLSPSQIKNSANIIVAKRNAEQRKIEKKKEEMAKSSQIPVEAPAKVNKRSLSESFYDNHEEMGEFADEDEMEIMED